MTRTRVLPNLLIALLALLLLGTTACSETASDSQRATPQHAVASAAEDGEPADRDLETAIFAAGCFWCVEEAFDEADGVVVTTSGYLGGDVANPSYEQVSSGGTGHTEAVQVEYDPDRISYQELLDVFWVNVDPTDAGGQFCDRGSQYRGGIFHLDAQQKALAEASKTRLQNHPEAPSPIVTEITEAGTFYPAEEYHQDYYTKNPIRYKFYKTSCGREGRLEDLWADYLESGA